MAAIGVGGQGGWFQVGVAELLERCLAAGAAFGGSDNAWGNDVAPYRGTLPRRLAGQARPVALNGAGFS